jgi:hypothetical protein
MIYELKRDIPGYWTLYKEGVRLVDLHEEYIESMLRAYRLESDADTRLWIALTAVDSMLKKGDAA